MHSLEILLIGFAVAAVLYGVAGLADRTVRWLAKTHGQTHGQMLGQMHGRVRRTRHDIYRARRLSKP